MATFFLLDESVIGPEPSGMLDAEFSTRLQGVENRPNIFAELCVLDMLLAIYQIRGSYYKERLVLKGGAFRKNVCSSARAQILVRSRL